MTHSQILITYKVCYKLWTFLAYSLHCVENIKRCLTFQCYHPVYYIARHIDPSFVVSVPLNLLNSKSTYLIIWLHAIYLLLYRVRGICKYNLFTVSFLTFEKDMVKYISNYEITRVHCYSLSMSSPTSKSGISKFILSQRKDIYNHNMLWCKCMHTYNCDILCSIQNIPYLKM